MAEVGSFAPSKLPSSALICRWSETGQRDRPISLDTGIAVMVASSVSSPRCDRLSAVPGGSVA